MWVSIVANVLVVVPGEGSPLDVLGVRRALHSDPRVLDESLASQVVGALRVDGVKPKVLSFERLLPTPDGMPETVVTVWRLENWGTPTDAWNSDLLPVVPGELLEQFELVGVDPSTYVAYRFFSNVETPELWLGRLAGALPGCRIYYSWLNEMKSSWGVMCWDDGVLTKCEKNLGEVTSQNIFLKLPDPNGVF